MARIEAARRAFPLRDGGSTHGFDILIIEERLRSSSLLSGQQLASAPHTVNLTPSAPTQAAGDDPKQWNMSSGSALIRHLVESEQQLAESLGRSDNLRSSLFVGVTARLAEHKEKLKEAGADCVWGKPPPEMNSTLRNELLKLLMRKRKSADSRAFD